MNEAEPKKKRGPLTATERLTEARDQQKRYVDKLSERLQRRRLDVVAAETQYQSAFEELRRIEAALPSSERTRTSEAP